MRLLVAPQEYKGTLTAVEAAEAMVAGLRRLFPDAEVDIAPMADGGPGTAEALQRASGGEWRSATVHDPLMRLIEARWLRRPDGTAVIECAEASGLLRLLPSELDPLRASTFGTGELIAAALDAGCRDFIIGLGGSATNDGGAGMAQALGYRLLDASGDDLQPGGAALLRLVRIDVAGALEALESARFVAATDVRNPLCGPEGASAVYGPQKGASPADVNVLDSALRHFAAVIQQDLGLEIANVPGAGAAGGLGAGVVAFLGARIESGAEVVGRAAGLEGRVRACDAVITGEGRLDGQTAFGKATAYVARRARAGRRPVVCLPGSVGPDAPVESFDVVLPLVPGGPVPDARATKMLLADRAAEALARLGIGRGDPGR
jgi:glycerate kinase